MDNERILIIRNFVCTSIALELHVLNLSRAAKKLRAMSNVYEWSSHLIKNVLHVFPWSLEFQWCANWILAMNPNWWPVPPKRQRLCATLWHGQSWVQLDEEELDDLVWAKGEVEMPWGESLVTFCCDAKIANWSRRNVYCGDNLILYGQIKSKSKCSTSTSGA